MSADGNWNVTINTPMGSQDVSLALSTEGGELSGTLSGPQGSQDFSGGTADGDSLSWVVDMTQPMPMKIEFSATVDGDNISGTANLGSFGSASFSGSRA